MQKKYNGKKNELQLWILNFDSEFDDNNNNEKTQHPKLIILKLSPVYKLLVFIFVVATAVAAVGVGVGVGSYETDLNQFLRSFEQTYYA